MEALQYFGLEKMTLKTPSKERRSSAGHVIVSKEQKDSESE